MQYEIPDEIYEVIEKMAARKGSSVEAEVLDCLVRTAKEEMDNRTEEEKQAARERFRRHFGSVNLGHPIGIDNEQIDADLAREYDNTHEDEN